MLRPISPQPGEYIRGHAGRLSLWNGFLSAEELLVFLCRRAKKERGIGFSSHVYRLMAPFSERDPLRYLTEHSLLPFCRIGTREGDVFDYHGPTGGQPRSAWMQPKDGAYLCLDCVAGDERTHGFSYWRAFHQLPGIDACAAHGKALAVVKRADAFDRPPGSWAAARPVNDQLVALRVTPVVDRYETIAYAFMSRGHRVHRLAAAQCIGMRVAEIGAQTERNGSQFTLADCIREAFPAAWLEAHYPRLYGSEKSEKIVAVNAACTGSVVDGIVYAMALAATFSTSMEAINAFYATQGAAPEVRVSAIKSVRLSTRRDRLLPYYIANEGRATRIAKALGVSHGAVFNQLRSVGLPPLGHVPELDRQRVIAFLSRASEGELDHWAAAGSNIDAL